MTIYEFIVKYKHILLIRNSLIDLLTECDRTICTIEGDKVKSDKPLYIGQIVQVVDTLYGVTSDTDTTIHDLINFGNKTPMISIYDKITLQPGDLDNVSVITETTVGRFLLNYALLAEPFGNLFPYINKEFVAPKIEKEIIDAALSDKISVDSVSKHYIPNLYFIGSLPELIVPGYSEKSLTPSPTVLKRKQELLEIYKDQLTDPVVMTQIEDELISMFREELKDDPSYGFFGSKKKLIDICLKSMLITGGILDYDDGSSQLKYKFVDKSLDDEWDVTAFSAYCNVVRRGIYARSMDSALGGTITDFIRRIFQDSKIVEKDCKTTRTFNIVLKEEHIKKYLYAYVLENRELVKLTPDNIKAYVGKVMKLRSPMYCESQKGYCQICTGGLMEQRNTKHVATIMSRIGSRFLSEKMSAMHGSKHQVLDISSVNSFVI